MKFRAIRGTKDILPGEVERWRSIEDAVHRVMKRSLYREIRTPIFEQTSLFARSIGEHTDIVSKEMYTFTDRSQESLTLKPEGTASVLRAYLQHNLGEQSPLSKLYYLGPMFRQERPQAGRLRQFHQFGAEAIGSADPASDVEIISLAAEVFRELGLKQFTLKLNSVGCQRCRPAYKKILVEYFGRKKNRLSDDSQKRLETNPMRVLDSKDENDQTAIASAPLIMDHLCEECRSHLEKTLSLLQAIGLSYQIDGRLVRGLDYYTRTAFEITSRELGSQDALAGGGRYDLLVEELGGKATPAVGFAAGIERLAIALDRQGIPAPPDVSPQLFLVAADDESRALAFRHAVVLRSQGFRVEVDFLGRSIKSQMREANRSRSTFVAVIGAEEMKSGSVRLKRMETGEESAVRFEDLGRALS